MKKITDRLFNRYFCNIRVMVILSLVVLLANDIVNAQDDLSVVKNNWLIYSDAPNSLYHYLSGQAFELLKKRADAVSGINSLSVWQQRQNWIKETLLDIVGPFS